MGLKLNFDFLFNRDILKTGPQRGNANVALVNNQAIIALFTALNRVSDSAEIRTPFKLSKSLVTLQALRIKFVGRKQVFGFFTLIVRLVALLLTYSGDSREFIFKIRLDFIFALLSKLVVLPRLKIGTPTIF